MKISRTLIVGFVAVLLLISTISTVWAARDYRRDSRLDERRPVARHIEQGYVLDKRHRHNYYYPRHGYITQQLPHNHRKVVHRGTRYYFSGGSWYRPLNSHFSVIAPPLGLVIPVLPRFYTTVWFSGEPYYYAAGTYYRWAPRKRGYIVTDPPHIAEIYEEPEVPDQLFIYPRAGQDEKLQALDRYECHRWAVDQSGFDPTQPGGNVPVEENAMRRSGYNRATKSCLEAREYSVQ